MLSSRKLKQGWALRAAGNPVSQVAYPEYGPNMMWNVKYSGLNHSQMMGGGGGYGMMGASGGMMNGWNFQSTPSADVSAEMTITPEEAVEYAQAYLDANLAGAVAADDPAQFYGYYTLDFTKDGEIIGMLSVNGITARSSCTPGTGRSSGSRVAGPTDMQNAPDHVFSARFFVEFVTIKATLRSRIATTHDQNLLRRRRTLHHQPRLRISQAGGV
jgi:hypothetical protein